MASGELVLERLRPPEVTDFLIQGAKFVKWDDDSTTGQNCEVKVDPAGHLVCWRADDKEAEFLELVFVRDVRTGRSAKLPKDQKLKDSLKFGGSEDEALQDKTVSVVHGYNMFDVTYINFVAASTQQAKQWTDALMKLTNCLLAINTSPMTFLRKQFVKIHAQTNSEENIPVKNILKYFTSGSKEDRRRVQEALQFVGLPHDKVSGARLLWSPGLRWFLYQNNYNVKEAQNFVNNASFAPGKFTFDDFWAFYNNLCRRQEIDDIFAEIGAKNKPYLTREQLVDFLNNRQRDPRLNEILYPYATNESAQALIEKYEGQQEFVKKGHFSVQGLTKYLMSDDNAVVNPDRLSLHQDMNQPLAHYFINSSHNTYLTGHQLTGKSSVEVYRQALLAGCRCVELDCWDGKTEEQEPVITHGMTLCTEISFKDVIEAIAECAFKTSEYPMILSFENHCTAKQQAKMAQYCVNIFGDMLLGSPLDDFPLEEGKPLPSPKALMRKIIIKNKKRKSKRPEEAVESEAQATADEATSPTPEGKVDVNGETEGETPEPSDPKKDLKPDVIEEVEAAVELSNLVNYIQPTHFKSFELSEKVNRSYEMSSFVETLATTLLKERPVEFVNYNKRQLSRIYPKGTRVGSENYLPQIFWNAGCQLVALNYQTLDLPMMLNLGIFEYNGRCGYILKPSFMRRPDKSFDPFAESTVDGIIAGYVEVKVISGQTLTDKKVGTYVDVEMYGLPADTVRKKYRTKVVPNNGINPVYDEEPFKFTKVVLPSLAVLRLAVYKENGELIGQRILPVNGLNPGYRHIKLRNDCGQPLCLPTLFVHIVTKDYVPSGFEDFAKALCDPIAYQSEVEKRGEQLHALMDDDDDQEEFSQTDESRANTDDVKPSNGSSTEKEPKSGRHMSLKSKSETRDSLIPEEIISQRRGSAFGLGARDSFTTNKPVLQSQISNPFPTNRSQSLQASQRHSESFEMPRRAVSMKRREGKTTSLFGRSSSQGSFKSRASQRRHQYLKFEPVALSVLKEHKNYLKFLQKQKKEMDALVKKQEKDKDKLQRNHFNEQEKFFKELEKERFNVLRKADKDVKKCNRRSDPLVQKAPDISSLTQEQDAKVDALKRSHREKMLELLRKQLAEQLDLASKQIEPRHEELERVMQLAQEEKAKQMSDYHARQMNELKKDQEKLNRTEIKQLSAMIKDKAELQRRKREQNKKYIEQSVTERQKLSKYQEKERQDLAAEQEKIDQELKEDKDKSFRNIRDLYDARLKSLSTSDLEVIHAALLEGEVTRL